jgi:DNA (cytosine-5)-methyltransferase 1
MKKRALDLFSGAGGATRGLQMAGYHVTGIDIRPQPRYCGDVFFQDDAMAWLRGEREPLSSFDLIWASPPCQAYSELVPPSYRVTHPDLLPETLEILRAQPAPYIVENVAGARRHFQLPVVLCGSMFGLPIQRHRWFEIGNTDVFFLLPPCNHSEPPILVSGRGMRKINGRRRKDNTAAEKYDAMEIDWMNSQEIEEAIPPAYSKFLAEQVSLCLS